MGLLQSRMVAIAKKEVGVREEGGNNLGKRVRDYQLATWLAPGAWPWCAAFVAFCLREALSFADVLAEIGMTLEEAKKFRCKEASVNGFINWALKNPSHCEVYREDRPTSVVPVLAKAGDIICFDFGHIGLCVADQTKKSEPIQCTEGNTNGKGERDSVYGDGVWDKSRDPKLAMAIIRLK